MTIQKVIKCEFDYLSLLDVLSDDPYLVFLDSSDDASLYSEFSYIAFDPFLIIDVKSNETSLINRGGDVTTVVENPFSIIQKKLEQYNDPALIPFSAGAIGFFSYESARFLDDFNHVNSGLVGSEITLGFYDKVFVYDHKKKDLTLIVTSFEGVSDSFNMDYLLSKISSLQVQNQSYEIGELKTGIDKASYSTKIDAIQSYIANGDIYQANLTYKNAASFSGSSIGLYKSLRDVSPAPYSAFLNSGFGTILSSSPEQLLTLEEKNKLSTRPIKGTISRGKTSDEDASLQRKLLTSKKDRAELLMIVDLERNDLSRVCEPGTVDVPELMGLESYSHLHHLVSTVTGKLDSNFTSLDAFKAIFPGGSITGAPKIRATEIIQDLEETRRNSYTGSIGFFSFDGSLKSNIAIRTMYLLNNLLSFHVGGGIVADSNANDEWKETILKAKGMLQALKQTERVLL
jgi:para-aminobenzoate synthetase component I